MDSIMTDRPMQEDDMWLQWQAAAPTIFDRIYYESNPLIARTNLAGHWLIEKPFPADHHFGRVLEVGAGTGMHFAYVRHGFDRYHVTDLSAALLDKARERLPADPRVDYGIVDALHLDFEDDSVDRLISVFNLEHLPTPHLALREWRRVVRPGGTISISLPTEGGLAWNLGRFFTVRRTFAKLGLNHDYIIAREHINACYRLVAFIRHYFPERREFWYPTHVPNPHVNLVFACSIRVTK